MIQQLNSEVRVNFKGKSLYLDLSSKSQPVTLLSKNNSSTYSVISNNDDSSYYVIYVTDDCNMKCSYCFNDLKKDDHKWNKQAHYTISEIISFICKRDANKEIGIRFFGGEPLLNKEWIYEFVNQMSCTNIKVKYDIFTNTTLLDEKFLRFAKENDFLFYVSINGGMDIYKGKYFKDKIWEGISKLRDNGFHVIARMVWQPNEQESLIDLVTEAVVNKIKVISITLPWGVEFNHYLFTKQIEEFSEFYLERILSHDYKFIGIAPIVNYIAKWTRDIDYCPVSCAAGKSMTCISTDGKCYPCHCFVNIDEFCCGDIYENSEPLFSDYSADTILPCKQCELRYFCKAKCAADAYFTNGTPYKMNSRKCIVEREIIGASAYILYQLQKKADEYSAYQYLLTKVISKYDNNQ